MIAQSVEHAAVNRSVVGSSPTQGAKILYLYYGPMAQLVRAPPCHGGGRRFESDSGRFLCRSGGTGRRPGLKIPWVEIPVPVRFRSAAVWNMA